MNKIAYFLELGIGFTEETLVRFDLRLEGRFRELRTVVISVRSWCHFVNFNLPKGSSIPFFINIYGHFRFL